MNIPEAVPGPAWPVVASKMVDTERKRLGTRLQKPLPWDGHHRKKAVLEGCNGQRASVPPGIHPGG